MYTPILLSELLRHEINESVKIRRYYIVNIQKILYDSEDYILFFNFNCTISNILNSFYINKRDRT